MHAQQLDELIAEYEQTPTSDNCRRLFHHIRRYSLAATFPMWFRCSELAKTHDLSDLYYDTFHSPVFTIDEYRTLAHRLLCKGCTMMCIHQICMYMLNPSFNVRTEPLPTTLDAYES